MRKFKIEVDTRFLTVEKEDALINALEEIECDSDCWSEFYDGEYEVIPVQLPECVKKDADEWVYGKIIVEGEVKDDVLETIYNVIEGEASYVDNDPFGIETQRFLMELIKFTVKNPEKGKILMERAREIAVGKI